jgi:hypothetical protein
MPEPPAGAPPFKGHRAAYRELLESLWYASETFEKEGDGGLEGAKLACRAVGRFTTVTHENPRLAAPFLTIMQSFNDLAQGLDPPLFSTNLKPRERERSSQRKHLQMIAAVAMEVLMALEHSLEDAAQQVAAAVQKWPAFHAQTITSTTIRNWRDQVRSPTDGRNPQFQQLRDHILGQLSPIAEVRKLLRHGWPSRSAKLIPLILRAFAHAPSMSP